MNWPVQSTGAVLLRLSVLLAARKGVRIIAPVHDALLIEARDQDIEEHVRNMKEAMDEACRLVLGDVLRTEHQIIHASGRFYDEKGKKLWDIMCDFMGWNEHSSQVAVSGYLPCRLPQVTTVSGYPQPLPLLTTHPNPPFHYLQVR